MCCLGSLKRTSWNIFQDQPLFMNKSFLSVKWMLIVVIVIILVIGMVSTYFHFFPRVEGGWACIQRQKSNIDEVLTAIDEVMWTGEEQIIRFTIEKCTKCIWYNDGDVNDLKLEVEYETSSQSFSTPIEWWGDIDTETECPKLFLVGVRTCTVKITVDFVKVTC